MEFVFHKYLINCMKDVDDNVNYKGSLLKLHLNVKLYSFNDIQIVVPDQGYQDMSIRLNVFTIIRRYKKCLYSTKIEGSGKK